MMYLQISCRCPAHSSHIMTLEQGNKRGIVLMLDAIDLLSLKSQAKHDMHTDVSPPHLDPPKQQTRQSQGAHCTPNLVSYCCCHCSTGCSRVIANGAGRQQCTLLVI